MAIKFEKIHAGTRLYDRHKTRAGNTTMTVLGEWSVDIVSVDTERRTALASWNGNRPQAIHERNLTKLFDWSMYDDCAEVTRGMIGVISVKKKKAAKP